MSRLINRSRMLGVCLLCVMLMSAPGCLEEALLRVLQGLVDLAIRLNLNNSTNGSVAK